MMKITEILVASLFRIEGSQHEAGSVIVLDIFQSGVTSIAW